MGKNENDKRIIHAYCSQKHFCFDITAWIQSVGEFRPELLAVKIPLPIPLILATKVENVSWQLK
jgi:hypothetical protein